MCLQYSNTNYRFSLSKPSSGSGVRLTNFMSCSALMQIRKTFQRLRTVHVSHAGRGVFLYFPALHSVLHLSYKPRLASWPKPGSMLGYAPSYLKRWRSECSEIKEKFLINAWVDAGTHSLLLCNTSATEIFLRRIFIQPPSVSSLPKLFLLFPCVFFLFSLTYTFLGFWFTAVFDK